MARLTRRRILTGLAGTAAAGTVGLRFALPPSLRPGPVRGVEELSPAARALALEALSDVDPAALWDVHAHVVGLGRGSGCSVDPRMRSHLHPWRRLQFDVYLAAAAMDSRSTDADYAARLLALQRRANPRGRVVLLAFDRHVDEAGREVPEQSPFHTPDEWVLRLARDHPEALPGVSIHPYRRDAVERLERAAEAGAVLVKWLPNAMGIDPASPLCDPFYGRLAELGLPLLTHAGLEKAVHAEEAQRLGNPLRLRRALDQGVRVIVAHCASLGESRDLEAGDGAGSVESFDLFLRLMAEERYEGLLFGEISALTLVNRCGRPLRELLLARGLHERLVNGSDYPLPAIDPMVSTWLLRRRDYLEASERPLLNELFEANALLFDYVLKRRVAVRAAGRVARFAPRLFESRRLFA